MKLPGLLALLLPLTLAAEEGFVPLFDGKTLQGWVNVNCAPETWSVRDGMIHCEGTPTGALRTERPYENFVLELEWRHLKPGGNAGIFIWSSPLPAVGVPFLRAIEVQVLDHAYGKSDWFTTHGDVFAIHGATMKPFPPSKGMRSFPTEERSKGSPEWNHYRVTCQDGTIRLAVNGKEVSGGTECVWRKGYIGLESEGSPVDWRNLRIKELPASGVPAEHAAPLAEPWKNLYDGRSLRGWQPAEGWKSADWQLTAGAGAKILWSEQKFGDFDWHCDWSWTAPPANPVPPVVWRAEGGREIALPPLAAARTKGWNRLEVSRRGTTMKLKVNGEAAGSLEAPAEPLTPGLTAGEASILFANPFVK